MKDEQTDDERADLKRSQHMTKTRVAGFSDAHEA